jgi:REP element-mobilizing transposase RayT
MNMLSNNQPGNSHLHHRRTIRIKGYDYSQSGAYFITICAYKQQIIFGDINIKKIIEDEWSHTATIRTDIILDQFVVMPNHVHGIIIIDDRVGAYSHTPLPAAFKSPSRSLGAIIRGFKGATKIKINEYRNTPGLPIWQRNYYEHVIRNEADLSEKRKYIIDNPVKWNEDEYNSIDDFGISDHNSNPGRMAIRPYVGTEMDVRQPPGMTEMGKCDFRKGKACLAPMRYDECESDISYPYTDDKRRHSRMSPLGDGC